MRVVEARVNGGNAVTIERDDDGLATQVGDYALTRDDATGQVLGGRLGSVVDEWTRDGFGRIDRHAVRRGSRSLYVGEREYDLLNRLVVLAETTDGTSVRTTFQYDSNGQLTESTRDGETTTYTYDEDGNRTEIDGPEGPETATFDARGRLRSQGDVRYSYSDDDERVSRTEGSGTTRYEYDDLSRLTAVALPDGTRIEYVLDGFGRRVGKRVDGAIQQGLLFRDFVSPLAELDASGRVRTRFVYATGQSVPEYMVRDGTVYRLITDALGSLRAVVDTTSGDVVQQIDYDAFGRILRDTNPGFQPFGFRGGLYDPDTRLVHFGGRDYDPEVGQRLAA
jgi:YD repeat-containing protein